MARPLPDLQPNEVAARLRENFDEIKPKLRGWLHAATAPLSFISFLVMMVIADRMIVRAGVAVFMISALLLFGTSALYHTRTWSDEARSIWRRLDHANIFVLIAGSYTPFALLILPGDKALPLLIAVWGAAVLGILFRVFWTSAPRWLYVPLYVAMGWSAVFFWGDFTANASTAVCALIATGGGLYTLGAVAYGFKWPNPWPRWYGFHEVFHTLTIAAFIVHYVGLSLLAYQQA